MKPEDFYLDETKIAEGVKLPLRGPDGRLTKEWLRVLSVHSDAFQAALTAEVRRLYEENPEAPELKGTMRELEDRFKHLLITAWSFDTDFTPAGAKSLLDRNPIVGSAVIDVARKGHLFFPDTSESSSTGHGKK